jgi:Beta-propeller repeat
VSKLAIDPVAPQVIFASGSMGISKSADSGQTWQLIYPLAQPYTAASIAIDPGNHLRVAALTQTGALIRSLDGGQTWSQGAATACPTLCTGNLNADPTGLGTLLVRGGGKWSISHDWGITFQNFGPVGGTGFPMAEAFDPSHPGWIYLSKAVGASGMLFLTTDNGATWTPKSSPPGTFSGIIGVAVDPDNPNVLAAETPGSFYKSADGGVTWTLETQGPSASSQHFSPEGNLPFALVRDKCTPGGGVFAPGDSSVNGTFQVSFSPDFGTTWQTPQLTNITSVTAAPACTFFVTRTLSSDAFVAKLAPDGTVLWATYLGGSDRDAPAAIALDAQGDAFITGTTVSPDFPATEPHIGVQGQESVFLTELHPDGSSAYSVTIGGEAANTAVALAIDADRNAYIAGTTDSLQFPITPGTLDSTLQTGNYSGFLSKLSPAGILSYATFLGPNYTFPGSLLVDAAGDAIVAGSGTVPGTSPPSPYQIPEFVMKLDSSASQVLQSTYLPGAEGGNVTSVAMDSSGNVVLFGSAYPGTVQPTPGAFQSQSLIGCESNYPELSSDAYLTKLNTANWQPAYTAVFHASCSIATGSLAVDSSGNAVLAMGATSGLQLRSPFLGGPDCTTSSAIAKLSADGSTLLTRPISPTAACQAWRSLGMDRLSLPFHRLRAATPHRSCD